MSLQSARDKVIITQNPAYSKQYMGRKNTNTGQNFSPEVALIGLSETGTWLQNVIQKIEEMIPIHFKNKMETGGF